MLHRRGNTIGGPCRGRQSCRFLETGSLSPPLAALHLFPPIFFSVAPKRKRAVHGHLRAKSRRFAAVALRNAPLRLHEKKHAFRPNLHPMCHGTQVWGCGLGKICLRKFTGFRVGRGKDAWQSSSPFRHANRRGTKPGKTCMGFCAYFRCRSLFCFRQAPKMPKSAGRADPAPPHGAARDNRPRSV